MVFLLFFFNNFIFVNELTLLYDLLNLFLFEEDIEFEIEIAEFLRKLLFDIDILFLFFGFLESLLLNNFEDFNLLIFLKHLNFILEFCFL